VAVLCGATCYRAQRQQHFVVTQLYRSDAPFVRTFTAVPTQNDAQEMVQDTGRECMDQCMKGGQERPRDIQAHADAHQEGAAAPREAQQERERSAGAAADREDRS
jgi:hypothetical protein